jgi:hypothetical protein
VEQPASVAAANKRKAFSLGFIGRIGGGGRVGRPASVRGGG